MSFRFFGGYNIHPGKSDPLSFSHIICKIPERCIEVPCGNMDGIEKGFLIYKIPFSSEICHFEKKVCQKSSVKEIRKN